MDVCGLFIGDTSLAYGSMRGPMYRDYEKFPYGTLEDIKNPTIRDYYTKVQEKCQQSKEKKDNKEECPFCKEQKKRPLTNYLRRREIKKSHEKICEVEDEDSSSEESSPCEEHTIITKTNEQKNETKTTEPEEQK